MVYETTRGAWTIAGAARAAAAAEQRSKRCTSQVFFLLVRVCVCHCVCVNVCACVCGGGRCEAEDARRQERGGTLPVREWRRDFVSRGGGHDERRREARPGSRASTCARVFLQWVRVLGRERGRCFVLTGRTIVVVSIEKRTTFQTRQVSGARLRDDYSRC